MQLEKRRYSAPYKLVGQTIDARLSESTVRLYYQHELQATHPRLTHPGQRSTFDEHLPPEHLANRIRDPVWCRQQAKSIGPHCETLIERLSTQLTERLCVRSSAPTSAPS